VKTVPTVRLVEPTDPVADALPDLPEEIQLAMADIAGAAREGLLAMSVAAGMAVMQAMFEAEMVEACGPRGAVAFGERGTDSSPWRPGSDRDGEFGEDRLEPAAGLRVEAKSR
jgi:hypothetical protein